MTRLDTMSAPTLRTANGRPSFSRDAIVQARAGTSHPLVFENCPEAAETMNRLLAAWPTRPDIPEGASIVVARTRSGYAVTSPWLDEPLEAESPVSACCAAIIEIARSYLATQDQLLCLHCAAFETGDGLLLIAGTNRSGKSTLASLLGAEGWPLYCDDMLPIDTTTGTGTALGIPPRLRLPLPAAAPPAFHDYVAAHMMANDHRYGYLAPRTLVAHGTSAPIAAMVLLDRRETPTLARLSAVDKGETLRHLLLRNLHREVSARFILDRLHAIMQPITCYRLTYSDLADAADVLGGFRSGAIEADAVHEDLSNDIQPMHELDPDHLEDLLGSNELHQAPGAELRQLEGEWLLLDPEDQAVLHLNALGAGLWNVMEEPISFGGLAAFTSDAFPEIPRERIRRDVAGLVGRMLAEQLLVTVAGTPAGK